MRTEHRYAREALAEAVASSHSWRGVLRRLGRLEHSAGAMRVVRREVKAYGIDHSHFTGQRRWSDRQLIDAIAAAHTWGEVQATLGLSENGGDLRDVRTHATRLGIDTAHLSRLLPGPATQHAEPQLKLLRTAGPTLAAAWFMLRGYEVVWPLEPCRYDLVARVDASFQRIQVKTATYRNAGCFVAHLANSRRVGRARYDVDEIDSFFVIDAELNAYLIPFADVAGYTAISLRRYAAYLVGARGNWLENPLVAP